MKRSMMQVFVKGSDKALEFYRNVFDGKAKRLLLSGL